MQGISAGISPNQTLHFLSQDIRIENMYWWKVLSVQSFHANESGNIITCKVVPVDVVGSKVVVVGHKGKATEKIRSKHNLSLILIVNHRYPYF